MDVTPEHMIAAAKRYWEEFEWPATAHGWAVWVLSGQVFDAIEVATDEIPDQLDTPVIAAPGKLIYLTELSGAPRWRRIELPPTRVPNGELTWVSPPSKNYLTTSSPRWRDHRP